MAPRPVARPAPLSLPQEDTIEAEAEEEAGEEVGEEETAERPCRPSRELRAEMPISDDENSDRSNLVTAQSLEAATPRVGNPAGADSAAHHSVVAHAVADVVFPMSEVAAAVAASVGSAAAAVARTAASPSPPRSTTRQLSSHSSYSSTPRPHQSRSRPLAPSPSDRLPLSPMLTATSIPSPPTAPTPPRSPRSPRSPPSPRINPSVRSSVPGNGRNALSPPTPRPNTSLSSAATIAQPSNPQPPTAAAAAHPNAVAVAAAAGAATAVREDYGGRDYGGRSASSRARTRAAYRTDLLPSPQQCRSRANLSPRHTRAPSPRATMPTSARVGTTVRNGPLVNSPTSRPYIALTPSQARQDMAANDAARAVAAALARTRRQADAPLSPRSVHGSVTGGRGAGAHTYFPANHGVGNGPAPLQPRSGGVTLPSPGGSISARAAARGNVPGMSRPTTGGHVRGAEYYHLFS